MKAPFWRRLFPKLRPKASSLVSATLLVGLLGGQALASTYAVYIPLDSPIYLEFETLSGLGWLDTYLDEIKPISRVEAARLTIEAEKKLEDSESPDPLAASLVRDLRAQFVEEIGWLENNTEDKLPTMIHPVQRLEMQYVFSSGRPRLDISG